MKSRNQVSLAELRDRIAELQDERRKLLAQRHSRAEVAAAVDGMLAHWQETGAAALARELQRVAAGQPGEPLTVKGSAAVAAAPGAVPFALDLAPLLVSVLGADAVRGALARALEHMPAGLPAAERRERLAAIADELDALERDEEALIEQSEADGGPIDRRPDARPEIILAAVAP